MSSHPPLARAAEDVVRPSGRHWWRAVLYIAAVAMLLRFYNLPLKPLHHDEGVNGLFLTALVRPPHAYRYDPANYHGPTLYYAAWLSTTLFASPTFAIRCVTGVAGWLSVLLMLTFRRSIGVAGALTAAALLAVSPGSVYFSRYFIHEALLVCTTVGLVAAAVRWLDSRRPLFLYLAAASAGLMVATKETAIITAVVLAVATAGTVWLVPAANGDGRPRPSRWHVASMIDVVRQCLDPHRRGSRQIVYWMLALAVFCAVNLVFYTSLFTHPAGALDALRSLAPWMHAGTSTHTHPWHTYVGWLLQEELPLLLMGAAGTVIALVRADQRFAVFAGLWAIGMMLGYSAIPYKTPWLTLNIVTPLAITSGYAADVVWRRCASPGRAALTTAAVGLLTLSTYQAVTLSFFRYDDESYAYVYVHTDRDILAMVQRIDRLRTENGPLTIAVTSESHFPLSWYLRDYAAGFYGRPIETNHSVVIGSRRQHDELVSSLADRYENLGPYRLRPGVDLELFARRDLKGLESGRRSSVAVVR